MACGAIFSGDRFLWAAMTHIDCQARSIGSYGYEALADPASSTSILLSGALTLFVALFGFRLILGRPTLPGDLVHQFMKVAIVLLMATSWPAWRILAYDVVLDGPTEIAQMIGGRSGLPNDSDNLRARLQGVDDGLVALTRWGTGRMPEPDASGSMLESFRGIALADETGLGWGRLVFLVGAIGPYAALSLTAGLLLALAPLMAGLLLFGGTIGIFLGWIRALTCCAFGSLALYIVQRVEVAVLEPWLTDLIAQRSSGAVTPSGPTELMALALSFAVLIGGVLLLLARMTFHAHLAIGQWTGFRPSGVAAAGQMVMQSPRDPISLTRDERAYHVGEAVAATVRREERDDRARSTAMPVHDIHRSDDQRRQAVALSAVEPLGSSFRRSQRRISAAGRVRDGKP